MRRPITSIVALALAFGAALIGQVASGQAAACLPLEPDGLREATEGAAVIVIAEVLSSGDELVLRPETYYKGAADRREFVLQRPHSLAECPPAELVPGSRVLAFLGTSANRLAWPDPSRVFILDSGTATNTHRSSWALPEGELVHSVRDLTGQESVPASDSDDGSTIDWTGTVLPLTAALVVVFGIGLVMMRVWHRIDPS